jgi:putative nucleotidyltransferase with HDIG domain
VSLKKNNFRRLLLTFEALSDLGPQLTSERSFEETAAAMITALLDASGAREAALFTFSPKPALLNAVAAAGFAMLPDPAVIPLLPKHVYSLTAAHGPQVLSAANTDEFLSANGNVAPELFKCVVPLKVAGKLVGVVALGRHRDEGAYDAEDLELLGLLCNYLALAVQNHALNQSLTQRVSENLRLLSSVHGFYDSALEAFATAIDVKHVDLHGHSMRVGRYSAAISEALGMDPAELTAIRSAGYLHDIGKVAVDKALFGKPSALDPEEFREIADHTTVGHKIVSGVQFPWPRVAEIVRWHHERADGSGYPDGLQVDEVPPAVRIVGVADTFDAMTSARPYREPLSVGAALSEIVRLAPLKYDPAAVQGLLVQVRRDAVGSNRVRFLEDGLLCNISPSDVDQLASTLQHRITQGRTYLT